MNKVFVLTTYEYSCYSYSGLVENGINIFSTKENAENYAKDCNLRITCDPDRDTDCTIESYEVD